MNLRIGDLVGEAGEIQRSVADRLPSPLGAGFEPVARSGGFSDRGSA